MGNETETCNGAWRLASVLVSAPVTTISCTKILSNWPNEAKNSCVLRLLISSRREGGQHEAPLRLQDLPRMLNAAIQTARSFTGRLADGDVEAVGDGLAPLVARGYTHGSRAGYRRAGERSAATTAGSCRRSSSRYRTRIPRSHPRDSRHYFFHYFSGVADLATIMVAQGPRRCRTTPLSQPGAPSLCRQAAMPRLRSQAV
jgi:hypothetical protein